MESLIVCDGTTADPCTYLSLIELARVLITNLVFLSTFIVVFVAAYAGIKLLASGGNESALKDAKTMAWKVIMGYVWILAAWLIVYTISSALLNPGFSLLGSPTPN